MKKTTLLAVLAMVMLLGAASSAVADSSGIIPGVGNPPVASGNVTVKAQASPKLELTITTPDAIQTVDFGVVDPGTATGGKAVTLLVKSNKEFSITKTPTGDVALMGLTTSLADSTANAKTAGATFTDNYSINVPWTTEAGQALSANVLYTVSQ